MSVPYFVATTDGMHETDWIVYANGEEIARVQARDAIETEFAKALLEG